MTFTQVLKFSISLIILSVTGLSAHAQSDFGSLGSPHSVYGNFGFTEGGFALGADYEYAADPTFGIGGYTRFYKKDSELPKTTPGYFTFGAFIRPHFNRKNWDLYVSPGFGVISIDGTTDKTTVGPSLAIGLLYQVQSQIAIGVENMKHYVWFSEDYRGLVVNDFMIKAEISF